MDDGVAMMLVVMGRALLGQCDMPALVVRVRKLRC